MPEYKWPSKVTRYGIECPYQRFLIVKYEAVIDWNGDKITTPEALDKHIREKMLPTLKKRIDPESPESHYCRNINLEQMLANPAPHIEEARQIMNEQGEDAARTFLLDHINRHKKEAFDGWWTYLTKGNPVYTKSPAFQYLVLRPVIDSSDAKSTRSPINPDAEVLAYLHDGIQRDQIAPTAKLLRTICEFMAFGRNIGGDRPTFGTACGWVTVTLRMAKAANRVAALSQGSGWCVASPSMAASYLSWSDFHLLLENGRPVAAIRTYESTALEIQGRFNEDPGPWWSRILLYCAVRGFSIEHRSEEAAALSAEYRRTIQTLDSIPKLAAHLAKNPAHIQFVPQETANDEQYRPVIEESWRACLLADPVCVEVIPNWMTSDPQFDHIRAVAWSRLIDLNPREILRMPKDLQCRDEVKREVVQSWASILKRDPRSFCHCPSELYKHDEIIRVLKSGWQNIMFEFPRAYGECPPIIQDDPKITSARKYAWAKRIRGDLSEFDQCPSDLAADPDIKQAQKDGWIIRLRRNPPRFASCPPDLVGDPEIKQARKAGWILRIRKNPSQFARCPPDLAADLEVKQAGASGWSNRIRDNPHRYKNRIAIDAKDSPPESAIIDFWRKPHNTKDFDWTDWMKAPPFAKSDPVIAHRAVVPITRELRTNPGSWTKIVSPWREMQELREEAAQNWATTPSCDGKEPPEDIQALVEAIRNS